MAKGKHYDHPNYLVVREKHVTGALSCTAVNSGYVGSTLRTRDKSIVIGCAARVASGGSAAGSISLSVARLGALGTASIWKTQTAASSAGASAAGDIYDISLASALTLESMGMAAHLSGNAASLDKVPVLSDIVWRYRILPFGSDSAF